MKSLHYSPVSKWKKFWLSSTKTWERPHFEVPYPLSAQQVTAILEVCLTTTYFRYEVENYVQIGVQPWVCHSHCCQLIPIIANLFTEDFEEKSLTTFPHPPRYWGRDVDHTMTVIKTIHIASFTNHLNIIHPNIKFTSEQEEGGLIPRLDTQICMKEDVSLKFKVYHKDTQRPPAPIY